MQEYKNLSGKSGVVRYETGEDYIIVEFEKGKNTFYKYSHSSAGKENIDAMKQFARDGQGLNSYIKKNVNDLFEK